MNTITMEAYAPELDAVVRRSKKVYEFERALGHAKAFDAPDEDKLFRRGACTLRDQREASKNLVASICRENDKAKTLSPATLTSATCGSQLIYRHDGEHTDVTVLPCESKSCISCRTKQWRSAEKWLDERNAFAGMTGVFVPREVVPTFLKIMFKRVRHVSRRPAGRTRGPVRDCLYFEHPRAGFEDVSFRKFNGFHGTLFLFTSGADKVRAEYESLLEWLTDSIPLQMELVYPRQNAAWHRGSWLNIQGHERIKQFAEDLYLSYAMAQINVGFQYQNARVNAHHRPSQKNLAEVGLAAARWDVLQDALTRQANEGFYHHKGGGKRIFPSRTEIRKALSALADKAREKRGYGIGKINASDLSEGGRFAVRLVYVGAQPSTYTRRRGFTVWETGSRGNKGIRISTRDMMRHGRRAFREGVLTGKVRQHTGMQKLVYKRRLGSVLGGNGSQYETKCTVEPTGQTYLNVDF